MLSHHLCSKVLYTSNIAIRMDCNPFPVQADRQVPSRESSDRNPVQVPSPERGPGQLLRVAARKLPRPSSYATTTSFAPQSATEPSLPQDMIHTRDTANPKPSTIASPLPSHSQPPSQKSALPFRQPARRLTLKRQNITKESTFTRQSTFTAQGGVGESKSKPIGKVVRPQRYGQILHKSSLSPEADRKVSQLPLQVDKKNQFQNSVSLAARQPIQGASDALGRDSARRATQGIVNESIGTQTPPSITPPIDIPLAANQEVIVRAGQQSLCLRNMEGSLALRDGDTWRSLEDLVGIRRDLK